MLPVSFFQRPVVRQLLGVGVALTISVITIGLFFGDSIRQEAGKRSCLANLRRMGVATALYQQDYDGYYPFAYRGKNNWIKSLQHYDPTLTDSCPIMPATWEKRSYSTNAYLAGTKHKPAVRQHEIEHPERVLWICDSNKTRSGQTPLDTMAPGDYPLQELEMPEQALWYQAFLENDFSDRHDCPYAGPWSCKAPAYWHYRNGRGRGKAGVLFSDGHATLVAFGDINAENIFPRLDSNTRQKLARRQRSNSLISGQETNRRKTAYSVKNIGHLSEPDGVTWRGGAINERGQIVGGSLDRQSGGFRGFLWQDGEMKNLGTLPEFRDSLAKSINRAGLIAGYAYTIKNEDVTDRPAQAVLWRAGKIESLGTVPGFPNTMALSVNDREQIVGYGYTDKVTRTHAFVCEKGQMRLLPHTSKFVSSRAWDINRHGQIAGWVEDANGVTRAVLWEGDRMTVLPLPPGAYRTMGWVINDHGQMVCSVYKEKSLQNWLCLWENGEWTNIGALPRAGEHKPTDINEAGVVVGDVGGAPAAQSATDGFIWEPGSGLLNLSNQLQHTDYWDLYGVFAVNNAGQVFAWGIERNKIKQACLLTPGSFRLTPPESSKPSGH